VSALEKNVDALLANQAAPPPNDLRSLRGAFTADVLMKQTFDEGQKIREAERKRARRPRVKEREARS
jgi:hypothetical protein